MSNKGKNSDSVGDEKRGPGQSKGTDLGGQPKGTHLGGIRTPDDIRQRCHVDPNTGCWHWRMAFEGGAPIATIYVDGKHYTVKARKASLLLAGKKPRAGEVAFSKVCCPSPEDCVNWQHARFGSWADFMSYRSARGHFNTLQNRINLQKGILRSRKITAALGLEIEADKGLARDIAARVGLSEGHVNKLRREQRYTQLAKQASVFNLGAP